MAAYPYGRRRANPALPRTYRRRKMGGRRSPGLSGPGSPGWQPVEDPVPTYPPGPAPVGEVPRPGPGPNAPNRDAPIGYHVNAQGQIVRNTGRRRAGRAGGGGSPPERPRPGNFGEPGPGPNNGPPGPVQGGPPDRPTPEGVRPEGPPGSAQGAPPFPPRFLRRLEQLGLRLRQGPDGQWRIVGGGAGVGSDEEMRLAQRAASRFGIMDNPWFDPTRAGLFQGTMYDLGTGSGLDNGGSENVLNDQQLARVQGRVGYSPETAYEQARANATLPSGYVPAGFQSPEAYQRYVAAARANYLANAGGQTGAAPGAPPLGAPPLGAPPGVPPAAPTLAGTGALQATSPMGPAQPVAAMGPGLAPGPEAGFLAAAQGQLAGLPLTGAGEQGNRILEDQLQAALAQITGQRGLVQPGVDLALARLGTDQGIAQANLDESLVGRGIYDSGIRTTDTQELSTQFGRGRQDLALGAAQQYADLDAQAAEAYGEFMRQLQELRLNLASDLAENPPPTTAGRRRRRRR
jgi:hypothetical protein